MLTNLKNGWPTMLKAWGIRHIRYAWHSFRFSVWWDTQGRYLGAFPNQSDMDHLQAIRDGKA